MGDTATMDPPASTADEQQHEEPQDSVPAGDFDGDAGEQPPTPPADLPDDGDGVEAQQQLDVPELELPADYELGLKVGGRKPDSCVLKFKGAKVNLGEGQFNREDRVMVVDIWQVTGDNDQDTINTATGEVKSTSKEQKATLCGTTRLARFVEEKLAGAGFSSDDIQAVKQALGAEE